MSIVIFIIGGCLNYWLKIIIIRGDSMNPALYDGDVVIVQKKYNNIEYNDIIVFEGDELNVKRVIALPNDTVELLSGKILVNGVKINPYYYDGVNKTYCLKGNEYFVIGDNYLNSFDSRDYGPIESSQILGKLFGK